MFSMNTSDKKRKFSEVSVPPSLTSYLWGILSGAEEIKAMSVAEFPKQFENKPKYLDDVLENVFRYLLLVAENSENVEVSSISPCFIVDKVLHYFITNPILYYKVCDALLSLIGIRASERPMRVLPFNHFGSPDDARYILTVRLYKERFGFDPPNDIWTDATVSTSSSSFVSVGGSLDTAAVTQTPIATIVSPPTKKAVVGDMHLTGLMERKAPTALVKTGMTLVERLQEAERIYAVERTNKLAPPPTTSKAHSSVRTAAVNSTVSATPVLFAALPGRDVESAFGSNARLVMTDQEHDARLRLVPALSMPPSTASTSSNAPPRIIPGVSLSSITAKTSNATSAPGPPLLQYICRTTGELITQQPVYQTRGVHFRDQSGHSVSKRVKHGSTWAACLKSYAATIGKSAQDFRFFLSNKPITENDYVNLFEYDDQMKVYNKGDEPICITFRSINECYAPLKLFVDQFKPLKVAFDEYLSRFRHQNDYAVVSFWFADKKVNGKSCTLDMLKLKEGDVIEVNGLK